MDRDEALEVIDLLVRAGFDTPERTVEILCEEAFDPDDLTPEDRDWVAAEVERLFARKREAERAWPEETIWDRLDRVFRILGEEEAFIALHDAGFTMSDGWSDVEQQWLLQGGRESGWRAYVFYHRQDVERAIETGLLYLAVDVLPPNRTSKGAACRIVADALTHAGFTVDWNGDPETRVAIDHLEWQKRSPG